MPLLVLNENNMALIENGYRFIMTEIMARPWSEHGLRGVGPLSNPEINLESIK